MKLNISDLVYATKSQTFGIITEIFNHKTNFFGRPGYNIWWQDEDQSHFYDTYSAEYFHKSAQLPLKGTSNE